MYSKFYEPVDKPVYSSFIKIIFVKVVTTKQHMVIQCKPLHLFVRTLITRDREIYSKLISQSTINSLALIVLLFDNHKINAKY